MQILNKETIDIQLVRFKIVSVVQAIILNDEKAIALLIHLHFTMHPFFFLPLKKKPKGITSHHCATVLGKFCQIWP